MRSEEIRSTVLVPQPGEPVRCVLEDEVEGVGLLWRTLPVGGTLSLPADGQCARVLITVEGEVTVRSAGTEAKLGEGGVYVPTPDAPVEVYAPSEACMLELRRQVTGEEMAAFREGMPGPYTVDYDSAPTYSEDCKSEKTVSRMLIPAGMIPRFAMGSVETGGDDMVAPHEHPMLEQIFLGLKGNDCTAVIDELKYPFPEGMLLHIPLGSSHGILSAGTQQVRYLWMDFLLDETAMEYMRTAHRMDGPQNTRR